MASRLFDVKELIGIGVALRLFEKGIDRWIAEREYLGVEWSREVSASDMIDWRRARRECGKADEPVDSKANEEIWRRAHIEHIRDLHG